MTEYRWTAIITLLALLVYFVTFAQVAVARRRSGIEPPAMTGDPSLERAVRVQTNTLEWLPVFLVSLWLFAVYWNEPVAVGLGLLWVVSRLWYAVGYMADPAGRVPGFVIQLLVTMVLLLGAFGRISYGLATGGG